MLMIRAVEIPTETRSAPALNGLRKPVETDRESGRLGRTFRKNGNDVRTAWPMGRLDNVQEKNEET